jgi:hypothetical protein
VLLANARLCAAAARTKAYPGSAVYRCQLRHSSVDDNFDDNVDDIRRYLANYCSLWKRRIGLFMHLLRTGRHSAAYVTAHS